MIPIRILSFAPIALPFSNIVKDCGKTVTPKAVMDPFLINPLRDIFVIWYSIDGISENYFFDADILHKFIINIVLEARVTSIFYKIKMAT
jgi:hypothetical protein